MFVRPASENEVSKLTQGRGTTIFGRELSSDRDTLEALLQRTELTELFGLVRDFNFNHRSFEFVIQDICFEHFSTIIKAATKANPQITLTEIVKLKWVPPTPSRVSREAGRPKATRDPATGKLHGVRKVVGETIALWEAGKDIESIRLSLHPTTRMPLTKSMEIGKIKRNLRRYKHLLTRPYVTK